ncbi:MAG: hypothetical protein LBS82_02595 [Spirochaetaceae bacterium]|jgi:hypothetical protein|nr:hypothetical protein [Spirochaetaceae bacterium]
MKKMVLLCAFMSASFAVLTAQTPESFDDALTEAANHLKAWEFRASDTVVALHFKAPTQALADFAIEHLTDALARDPMGKVVEKRNRPAALLKINSAVDRELSDAEAASYGQTAGATIALTGAFSPSGANWKLSLTAVSVAKRNVVWSDAYIIRPNAAFTKLATQAVPAPAVQTPAAPAVQTPAAPAPVASTPVSAPIAAPAPAAAPAKNGGDAFSAPREDLNTSEKQAQTFKRFGAWLDKNYPNIAVSELTSEKSYDKNKPYEVSFSWSHTDKIDVVAAMANFYKTLAELSKDTAYIEAIKEDNKGYAPSGKFLYYPTTYANKDESVDYKTFKSVSALSYAFNNYNRQLVWDMEFSLMDKAGIVIDAYKTSLRVSAPLGKRTESGSNTFTISEGAYQNMAGVALTKITMRHQN